MTSDINVSLAITELVAYSLLMITSLAVIKKQSIWILSHWLSIFSLSLLRITCSSYQIYYHDNNLLNASNILDYIGLGLLMFILTDFLQALNKGMHPPIFNDCFRYFTAMVIFLLVIVGITLVAVGGTTLVENASTTISDLGIKFVSTICTAILAMQTIITAATFVRVKRLKAPAQTILLCVAESVPPLWVHLSYSLLEAFDHNLGFVIDKAIVRALMVILMEIVVMGIYLAIGFLTCNVFKTESVGEGSLDEKDLD